MASFGVGRPGTASRAWASPEPVEVRMYTNNLFQDGDVLSLEEAEVVAGDESPTAEAIIGQPSLGAPKYQQQPQQPASPKVTAAQKRLERLQMSGLATSNAAMLGSSPASAGSGTTSRSGSLGGTGQPVDRAGSIGRSGLLGGMLGEQRSGIGSGRSTESSGGAPPSALRASGAASPASTWAEPAGLRSSGDQSKALAAAAAAAVAATRAGSNASSRSATASSGGTHAAADDPLRRALSNAHQQGQQAQGQAPLHVARAGAGLDVGRLTSEVEEFEGDADEVLPVDFGTPRVPVVPVSVDASDVGRFLMQPGRREGPTQCYIMREKGMYPRYSLFLEQGQQLLVSARKRKKSATSNYLIGLDPQDLCRESRKLVGKLRANFVGTDFSICAASGGKKAAAGQEPEVGCVSFQTNVLGTRGPRKMTAIISALDEQGGALFSPAAPGETLIDRYKSEKKLGELVVMQNKQPKWNEQLKAYCLNFNGRVTEASVKNFQLVADFDREHVILQFGKVGKNAFTMDYQWPINALQAFAICLSSFDNKLACE